MSAALHPAVAQLRAINLARDVAGRESYLAYLAALRGFAQALADDRQAAGRPWHGLVAGIVDLRLAEFSVVRRISQGSQELCDLMDGHDLIMIPERTK